MKKDYQSKISSSHNILFNRNNLLLFILLVTFCLIGVIIFTTDAYTDRFKFGKPNEIGDTIGGITAPIINIVSAILIYSTIKLQIKTNKVQFDRISEQIQNQEKERTFTIYNNELNNIENYYKNLTYNDNKSSSAISVSIKHLKLATNSQRNFGDNFNSINNIIEARIYILTNLSSIIEAIENKEFHKSEFDLLNQKVIRFYDTHLKSFDNETLGLKIFEYYSGKIKKVEDLKFIINIIQNTDYFRNNVKN
ncbi:hypothetical protein KO500_15215 [Cellulophaga baltica]|uniref:hypothetical protein n=1 Tax=Cellulophaga TaxID=104264 RepID=UPI001C06863D|nr:MULTISPECIES: hypothetical protein [Cellulophaga]MBU2997798.1 hypothetical protein [Cellulophaga baltica]MDO6769194.1 hypothetical protein [Cellulophaga sp. 1_MG-2023]